MGRALAAMLGLIGSTPAFAFCERAIDAEEVQQTVGIAEEAFSRVDIDTFLDATSRLETQLPCIDDAVTPELAGAVHRMQGLRGFVGRQERRASLAFAAARAVDPSYRFPEALLPGGHPALLVYEGAPPAVDTDPVPKPVQGHLSFDGVAGVERPSERPTLVQRIEADGSVAETAYLWPGVAMLVYDGIELPPGPVAAPATSKLPKPRPEPAQRGNGARTGLLAGAAGATVASGLLYGMASAAAADWRDPATPYEDLSALRGRTNTLTIGSAGLLVVAAGAGAGAVLVGSF